MSKTAIYLNFLGKTEEAFEFYRSIFGGEFADPIMRMGEVPQDPGQPEIPDEEKNYVMHVALAITGGTMLMGTDLMPSMGHKLELGNNVSINLMPDTKEEADKLFAGLSAGGSEVNQMQMMFWGDYWGSFVDKYGIRWMIDVPPSES